MVPETVFPETTPEKLQPWSTPGEVALSVTIASKSFPLIATLEPQLPVPTTFAVESLSEESASVMDRGEHCTPGSVRHPVHVPAIENVSVMAGAVVDADFEQPAKISADAARKTPTRIIFKLSSHSSIELFTARRRVVGRLGSVAYTMEDNMFIPGRSVSYFVDGRTPTAFVR